MLDLSAPWGFIVQKLLIELWFLLNPRFVSVDAQFELIVYDELWSLQMLFLSLPLSFFPKNHKPIKIIATLNPIEYTQINPWIPEDDFERQKHGLKKNKLPKSKFSYKPIPFKVYTLFFS